MKNFLARVKKLEASTLGVLKEAWLLPAKAALVKQRTMAAMSPEEQVLLTDSFGSPGPLSSSEFSKLHPDVWSRYNTAFDRATREVPAPYVMCTADLWGCW